MSDTTDQLLTRRTQQLRRWHQHATNGQETLAEHQAQTARIALEVAFLGTYYDVFIDVVNPEACAVSALYHDEAETLVSDISAYFKYLHPEARTLIHEWERAAVDDLWPPYPDRVQTALKDVALEVRLNETEQQIVKYADYLSALSFIREELKRGNGHMGAVHARQMAVMGTLTWPWLEGLRRKIKDLP